MQFFTTAAASCSTSSGLRALAPVIHTSSLAIAAASGSTAADLFAPVAGTSAPYGGYVTSDLACAAYELVVSYIVGDNCVDSCEAAPDTLTTTNVTIPVPAGQGVKLPEGFIAKITAKTTDGAGTALNTPVAGTLKFTSSRAGVCTGDVLVP